MKLEVPFVDPVKFQGSTVAALDPYRPSEYTGLLLQGVHALAASGPVGRALELGVGSGVVLAMLGLLGAEWLRGVDLEAEAVETSQALLAELGLADRAKLSRGDLWQVVADETFDTIVANLPHFPTNEVGELDRSPAWATGGLDGRALIDPFLAGLAAHLNPGGTALLTHSTIVDVGLTRRALARHGLTCRTVFCTHVRLGWRKARLLSEERWQAHLGRGLLRVGRYEFVEAQLLEIRWR